MLDEVCKAELRCILHSVYKNYKRWSPSSLYLTRKGWAAQLLGANGLVLLQFVSPLLRVKVRDSRTGLFGSCAWWSRGLSRFGDLLGHHRPRRCRHLETQADMMAGEPYEFGRQVKDIWTLRPSELRYESHKHGGLAWGAILWKLLGFAFSQGDHVCLLRILWFQK